MPTTLIVPLVGPDEDPEGASEAALPVARGLAAQLRADVVLLSVFEPIAGTLNDPSIWLRPDVAARLPSDSDSDAAQERRRYLDTVAARVAGRQVQVAVEVTDREPAAVIGAAVAKTENALIVMASHARRGLKRALLGSVTASVVGQAGCPVVVVPVAAAIPQPFALQRVVVPLDGSLLAEQVLELPFLATLPGLSVTLLQVIDPLTFSYGAVSDDYYAVAWEEARQYLTGVAERLGERGISCSWTVRHGRPAEQITQLATEVAANAIALATHGRSGFGRVLLGSVAEQLVGSTVWPLLLLRPTEAQLRVSQQERESIHPAP